MTSLGVNNFINPEGMKLISFQNIQNLMQSQKIQYKIRKMFLVFEIVVSELVAVNHPYDYGNTPSWESTC